jgi:hypothetical protein
VRCISTRPTTARSGCSKRDVLSDVVGMRFELTDTEHTVGGFSLDLIGKDLRPAETIIVKRQPERSDHALLGQLLTYSRAPIRETWCDADRLSAGNTGAGRPSVPPRTPRHVRSFATRYRTAAAYATSRAASWRGETAAIAAGRRTFPHADGKSVEPGEARWVLPRRGEHRISREPDGYTHVG